MENLRIGIRLQPRAAKPGIVGWENGSLKVKVSAPPVEGAANQALLRLLSKAFGLPQSRLAVVQGLASRNKVVEFQGADPELERKIKNYA